MWKAYFVNGSNISLLSEIKTAALTVSISPQDVEAALLDALFHPLRGGSVFMSFGGYYIVSYNIQTHRHPTSGSLPTGI